MVYKQVLNRLIEITTLIIFSLFISSCSTLKWEIQKGPWLVTKKNHLEIESTGNPNRSYTIKSFNSGNSLKINYSVSFRKDTNANLSSWNHARGFSLLFYIDDKENIEFKYFPDVKQLSLYIRDSKGQREIIKNIWLPEEEKVFFESEVMDSNIKWKINGREIFNETTSIKNRGYLILKSANNSCEFDIENINFFNKKQDADTDENVEFPNVVYNGRVTLHNFKFENNQKIIRVQPGAEITASTDYIYDGGVDNTINQIVIGLANYGPLTTIYNGSSQGSGSSNFTIKAPLTPGTYDLRFRYAQDYSPEKALKWWVKFGDPTKTATVGRVIVID